MSQRRQYPHHNCSKDGKQVCDVPGCAERFTDPRKRARHANRLHKDAPQHRKESPYWYHDETTQRSNCRLCGTSFAHASVTLDSAAVLLTTHFKKHHSKEAEEIASAPEPDCSCEVSEEGDGESDHSSGSGHQMEHHADLAAQHAAEQARSLPADENTGTIEDRLFSAMRSAGYAQLQSSPAAAETPHGTRKYLYHRGTDGRFHCRERPGVCEASLADPNAAATHCKRCRTSQERRLRPRNPDANAERYDCMHCDKNYPYPANLYRHYRTDHPEVDSKTYRVAPRPMNTHANARKYACSLCDDRSYIKPKNLYQHYRDKHPEVDKETYQVSEEDKNRHMSLQASARSEGEPSRSSIHPVSDEEDAMERPTTSDDRDMDWHHSEPSIPLHFNTDPNPFSPQFRYPDSSHQPHQTATSSQGQMSEFVDPKDLTLHSLHKRSPLSLRQQVRYNLLYPA